MEGSTGVLNDSDAGDQHESTAVPKERQLAESLATVLQQHKKTQAETHVYLEETVAGPLSLAFAAVVKTQPLGHLRLQLEAAEKERGEKAARFDSQGLTREDRKFLDALELVDWMGEEEFQNILDYVREALGVCACYVASLHHDKDRQSPVLHYVYADKRSRFLVDCLLEEDEGVLWDALAEPEEESEGQKDDQSTEDGEEEENAGSAEASAADVEGRHTEPSENSASRRTVKTLFVPDTMGEEKLKFWGMTRPGSFAAVPIILDDPACQESVDVMKEYLLEVRERDRLINERLAAKERARLEKEKSIQEASAADSRGKKCSTAASQHDTDEDEDEEEGENEEGEEDELPAPVSEPELVKKQLKMILCVDTLGMQDALSPEQLKRLAHFAAVVKEQCIRTRAAAVRKQADVAVNEVKLKERSNQVATALEEEENDVENAVELEKRRVSEELAAKLHREQEDREARREARLKKRAEEKRVHDDARQKQRAEQQRIREEKLLRRREQEEHHQIVADKQRERQAGAARLDDEAGIRADASVRDERKTLKGNEYEHDEREHAADAPLGALGDEDELDVDNGIDEEDEDEDNDRTGGDTGEYAVDEEEVNEPLDASVFLEEAEAKVKFQAATRTLVSKMGDVLLELQQMFIQTIPSAVPITAACLLLLGDSVASLRVNSKLPDSGFDWQKIRSRIVPSLLLRIGTFDPTASRHTRPSQAPVAPQEIALLQQIERMMEEASDGDERAPDLSSPLFLLERWLALAVDYRRKHLIATAMTLYRDAKINKHTLPKLEDADPDFTGIPLDRVLAVWEEE
ncbi:conserved hypothetical protein [Neospora caninum Liverpool]|uniref:Uncharacterized protein n=1 Tax=Neospora caninum (strain Liverpool) TaxID=572307 RepID=F0VH11_NEOCL|nr:conserved hypothetical protein [Neospora caninum Liverpool]CBZ53005.1 conserved hypothetical protein [Neospora caninum Liverpool]CEL66990.1 TPA: hypothetical protein BN1204_027940 [Neospora caninum Liverpool]|eukprot:XP_003883037.1 conserved hypothetical protein [Neospora caninum Liverpool]